jgi:hypothetical protein
MTDQKSSSTTTTEAHEVKSVREQVEGMGVETEQGNIVSSDPKTHSTPRTQHNDLDNSPTSSTKGKDLVRVLIISIKDLEDCH